jgi:hypothetical protein
MKTYHIWALSGDPPGDNSGKNIGNPAESLSQCSGYVPGDGVALGSYSSVLHNFANELVQSNLVASGPIIMGSYTILNGATNINFIGNLFVNGVQVVVP